MLGGDCMKLENVSLLSLIFVFLFILLAILFITKSPFARRCFSKFYFSSSARLPYIFFGLILLLLGTSIFILKLPAPYRIVSFVSFPVSLLLLFAFFLYLLYFLFKRKN